MQLLLLLFDCILLPQLAILFTVLRGIEIFTKMDPATAIGFVSGIITFIDFSWKVITGTREVYESATGTTSENVRISTIIADLQAVTQRLISNVEAKTKHEKALIDLADNCHELAQYLLKILEKLKVTERNSKWQSLKVKLESMRKGKEIVSIEKRLDSYRL